MSLLKKSGIRPVIASPCGSIAGRVDQPVMVVAVVGLLEPDLAPTGSIRWVRVGGVTW